VVLAHIAGMPVEETLAMAVPVLGATCVAFLATISNARRKRADRRRTR
jgi:hypothetical protein